ncbi:MAG TPA: hypothetical protein VGB04_04770 [Allosphingosinicella sp.]|jgi:hypothetical protein
MIILHIIAVESNFSLSMVAELHSSLYENLAGETPLATRADGGNGLELR